MDVPLIEFKDVTKRFGPLTSLGRVNLQIYEDQITPLIDLNGSGKSVLLKHIAGRLWKGHQSFPRKTPPPDEKEGNRCLFRPDELHVSRQCPLRLDDGL